MRPRLLCVGAVIALCVARAASGQVDPSGTWRTWTSEHFRIHARSELSSAAERLTREAERAYALLSRELAPPRGRIDVASSSHPRSRGRRVLSEPTASRAQLCGSFACPDLRRWSVGRCDAEFRLCLVLGLGRLRLPGDEPLWLR